MFIDTRCSGIIMSTWIENVVPNSVLGTAPGKRQLSFTGK